MILIFLLAPLFSWGLTFQEAKRILPTLHREHPYTIYCGCKFSGKMVDLKSCGYKIQKNAKRAQRLEWEHVVPAEAFGKSFTEWRVGGPMCRGKKGRKCAQKNPLYSQMEGDLYNLYPEIGELNGLRSNFSMAALVRTPAAKTFGNCDALIEGRKFQPGPRARGVVARTYMYMDGAYPGRGIVSEKNRPLFVAWDKQFPAEPWECKRAKAIEAIQKKANPILASRCP